MKCLDTKNSKELKIFYKYVPSKQIYRTNSFEAQTFKNADFKNADFKNRKILQSN